MHYCTNSYAKQNSRKQKYKNTNILNDTQDDFSIEDETEKMTFTRSFARLSLKGTSKL